MGINYFGFRIIDISDGNQVIDMRLRTPYETARCYNWQNIRKWKIRFHIWSG